MVEQINSAAIKYESIPRSWTEGIKSFFSTYSASFLKAGDTLFNEHIEVKIKHSELVCEEIKVLGNSLLMNDEELAFVELIAWLHDIGRFEQFELYGTFADFESENHAAIAVRVIENNNLLKLLPERLKEVVYRSILNHNIPAIPPEETKEIHFYSRLLRDADKLDIWRVSIEMNIFHKIKTQALPENYEIPAELLNSVLSNKIILLDQVQSFYDSILFRVSWVFDLNFNFSLQQVLDRNIVEKLLAKLPGSPLTEKISLHMRQYIFQKLG